MKNVLIAFCAPLLLLACGNPAEPTANTKSVDTTVAVKPAPAPTASVPKDTVLKKMSDEILAIIEQQKYQELAAYIHPQLGTRFSPEAFINTDANAVFHKESFLEGLSKNKKVNWGTYDALEENMIFTIPDYFKKFKSEFDYTHTVCNGVHYNLNKTSVTHGNTVNNIADVYKGCDYTEHYKDGCGKDKDVNVWYALRLVFKEYEGKYYLVGVIQDRPGV